MIDGESVVRPVVDVPAGPRARGDGDDPLQAVRLVRRSGAVLMLGAILALALPDLARAATLGGAAIQWQPLTLDVAGPAASETDDLPNPFLDVRLDVTFTAPSGRESVVPGFFAGNGLGYGTGNIWRARFTPDEPGDWRWRVRMLGGEDVAVTEPDLLATTTPLGEHGAEGRVLIAPRDPRAPGLLADGRLEYVGAHYLKQADGGYWIKGGVDSPENFFGYAGFDNTIDQPGVGTPGLADGVHRYASHVEHWREGDPLFTSETTGVDSKGIIGAVNYLASQGVNSIYLLPMNLGGDGRETYPFIGASGSAFDNTHYDVSKLYQWNLVFDHMQRRGIVAHLVLSEQEDGNRLWLDNGELGIERKLFHRELVARFAYLNGVKWNIGEESRYGTARERALAANLRTLDWAEHPVAVHTMLDRPDDRYLPLLGNPDFDTTSIQFTAGNAERFTETWRARSAGAGWPWVVDLDELGPAGTGVSDANMADLRRDVLYPVYFSGGNLEWYFGYHALPLGGDLRTEDFRTREPLYRWTRIAREFMRAWLPFERMRPNDAALAGGQDGDQVFSADGEVHALYCRNGREGRHLNVATGRWSLSWFDPREGRFVGPPRQLEVTGSDALAIGASPELPAKDWVVLLQRVEGEPEGDAAPPNPPMAAMPEPGEAVAPPGAAAPVITAPVITAPASAAPASAAPDADEARVSDDGGGAALWLLALLASARRGRHACAEAERQERGRPGAAGAVGATPMLRGLTVPARD